MEPIVYNLGNGFQQILNSDGTIQVVPVTQPQGIMVPAYETNQLDLVNQINQGSRNIDVPMTLEETMAGSVLPPDPRRFQSIFPTQATGIMKQAPLDMNRFQNVSDMSIIDETTNDEQSQEYIDEIKKSKGGGIAKLFEFISSLTPFGLAKRGIESLKGFSDRLQNTDFGQSKTLVDFLEKRKQRKFTGQDDPQGTIDRTVSPRIMNIKPTNQDKARGQIRTKTKKSAPKTDVYREAKSAFFR